MNLATLSVESSLSAHQTELYADQYSTTGTTQLLLLDRSEVNKELIGDEFARQNLSVVVQEVSSALSLLDQLEEKKWHCVVIVIDEITLSLSQLLKALPENNKRVPILILTKEYNRETALDYINLGAEDVIAADEMEYLVRTIQKKASATEADATISTQHKTISRFQHQHSHLIESLPLPYATVQEGIVVFRNSAFDDFFALDIEQPAEQFSLLEFIAEPYLHDIKKALREFANNHDQHNTVLEGVSLKGTQSTSCSANLYFIKNPDDEELTLQLIVQPTTALPSEDETVEDKATPQDDSSQQLLPIERFSRLLEQAINAKKGNACYALSLLEISNYETLKKQIGITRTETLLKNASDLIGNFTSQDTRVSRINSQVFALLVISNSQEKCFQKLLAIQEAFLATPVQLDEHNFRLTCNIGVAHLTANITHVEQALSLADSACAVSRNSKTHDIHVYVSETSENDVQSEDSESVKQVKDALKNEDFTLSFQPIIHIKDAPTPMYEVLIRLKDNEGEEVSPVEFLAAAKHAALCSDIDRWVISQAITVLRTSGQEQLKLFINITEASIQDLSFLAWLKTNDTTYLRQMIFEVSESIASNHPAEVLHFAQECKLLGIEMCLEHFGNSPEAVSELKTLSIKYCKIDGAFTNHLSTNRKNQMVINTISREAKNLGVKTIACCIQDANSLAVLWQEGIDYIQGNYLQSPKSGLNYQFNQL